MTLPSEGNTEAGPSSGPVSVYLTGGCANGQQESLNLLKDERRVRDYLASLPRLRREIPGDHRDTNVELILKRAKEQSAVIEYHVGEDLTWVEDRVESRLNQLEKQLIAEISNGHRT